MGMLGNISFALQLLSILNYKCTESTPLVENIVANGSRIAGGQDAQLVQFPYQVSIQKQISDSGKYRHMCGGSLITQSCVLTDATCIKGNLELVVGTNDLSDNTVLKLKASKATEHPGFSDITNANDIAVICLPKKIQTNSNIRTIKLANAQILVGESAITSRWGRTKNGNFPKILQFVQLKIESTKTCSENAGFLPNPNTICTVEKSRGTCIGDTGGPLVLNGIQIGVAATGSPSECGGGLSFFTDVSRYKDWILETCRSC